jgi:hypothetical protein
LGSSERLDTQRLAASTPATRLQAFDGLIAVRPTDGVGVDGALANQRRPGGHAIR